jgi:transposase
MKFSALPGWKITGMTEALAGTLVRAELLTTPQQCQRCEASSEFLLEHGQTEVRVKDIPERGKPVEIALSRRRYICSGCRGTSLQPMPGVNERLRATDRLVKLAAERAFSRRPRQVAEELCLTEHFVRAALANEVRRLEMLECSEVPRHLGLNVIYVNNRPRVLLTDADSHRVIGITPSADMMTTSQALLCLPGRERIKTVTVELYLPLKLVTGQLLPRATIIVERFSVMDLGNHAFEKAREDAHLYSSRLKDVKTLVAAAYFLKARFIDVFRTESSAIARRRYAEWVAELPEGLMFSFGPVVRTVNAWSEQIFGYFDHRYPEANREGNSEPAEDTLPFENGDDSRRGDGEPAKDVVRRRRLG